MNFKIFLLSIATLIVFFSNICFSEVGQLSNVDLKQMMDKKVPIIDIRRAEEWKSTGVVEGSHKMTFFDARGRYNLDKWLSELDKIAKKDESFILICRTGNRTDQVSNFLDKKLGYQKVYNVKDGIKKWIKAGNTVVSVK
ncbi:MAG: rhodanese-like domain-containing protein [gamma proteobacterium symbiont of Taylorina sp.]|nr:rhodanese-like domain-containing protein [gamma proteobacterium symbiont of Taylorina sp.]